MRFTFGAIAVLLVLFRTAPLGAQFDNGQISGFVRDASGAVVPGVVVPATNEGTRQPREAVSNEDGHFVRLNSAARLQAGLVGGRANDVLVTVDGAIANRTRSTENTMLGAQHADTVEEIQVLTSNYSAEYGRASSGIVRMVTKSGTSQFHGTLNYLLQNDMFNSNTWARNASGETSGSFGLVTFCNTASEEKGSGAIFRKS